MNFLIKGVCPVLPTVFDEKERVDFENMEKLIETLIVGDVNGITIFGVGSEFYKLSDNEKSEILKKFIKIVNNRVTTIVSITEHSTKNACERALEIQEAGASAAMILPPFFASPDITLVYKHIYTILKTIKIPVIIQYVPEGTNFIISEEVFLRLGEEFGNRIYFKIESKMSGPLISNLVRNKIGVLSGRGGITFYESLERGAIGVMPGCGLYDFFVSIYKNFIEGRKGIAFELSNRILPYLIFIDQSVELFLASEKRVLKLRGFIDYDFCRSPSLELDEVQESLINEFKNALGL